MEMTETVYVVAIDNGGPAFWHHLDHWVDSPILADFYEDEKLTEDSLYIVQNFHGYKSAFVQKVVVTCELIDENI